MAKLKTVEELFKGRHFAEAKSVLLKEKIAGLRRQMRALKVMEQTVQDAGRTAAAMSTNTAI